MTNPDEAAYGHGAENGHCCGLSKREIFAAMAMQGLITASGNERGDIMFDSDSHGAWAVQAADDLITALNATEVTE